MVTFEDPPPGLTIGHELELRVTVDAYFLKLLGYHAGDHRRVAPMLVGRLRWTPAQPPAPAPMVELLGWARKDGFVALFVLLLGYVALRGFFQVRKALGPSRPRSIRAPSEGLPPDQVADWLRNLPEEGPEDEDVDDIPPHRSR